MVVGFEEVVEFLMWVRKITNVYYDHDFMVLIHIIQRNRIGNRLHSLIVDYIIVVVFMIITFIVMRVLY